MENSSLKKTASDEFAKIKCGFWNILADGLSKNEFISSSPEKEIEWEVRGNKLAEHLSQMMTMCDLIGTVENDHPSWLLHQIKSQSKLEIKGIACLNSELNGKKSSPKVSPARRLRKPTTKLTFETENSTSICQFYGFGVKDPYICDETICIYFNSKRLKLIKCNHPPLTKKKEKNEIDFVFSSTDEDFLNCVFQQKTGSKKIISIIVAHLTSGEDYKKETKRIEEMKSIFNYIEINGFSSNTIILMDSNNSNHYESSYPENSIVLSKVIESKLYTNIASERGNECFKLRHAQGGQPEKFGQFMFDTIDKILVPNRFSGNQLVYDSFKKYPYQDWPILFKWRTNEQIRLLFAQYCSNVNNIKGKDNYIPKKVGSYNIDDNSNNCWNSSINSMEFDLLSKELLKINESDSWSQYEKVPTTETIRTLFSLIYPNSLAPSDHPPLLYEIFI